MANARVVKVLARRFGVGQWSFNGPGSEKKLYSAENSPQGAWDNIEEEMLLESAESGHPTFRATTTLSRGQLKSNGRGKVSILFAADEHTIDTIYRIILSVNQLSVYGAVAAICEEFESHQDGSGELEILMGQSIVLGEVKAEVPLQNEDSMNDQIIWQLSSLGQTPETFTGRILFMSMFNDISCEGKDNRQQCLRDADYVKTFAKRFGIGQWSFIGPGSEKKWYPSENSPQGEWDRIAEDMLLEFAKSGHPIFRATTPLSRGKLKSKGKGKVSIHFSAEPDTIDTIYRIILSVNQLSVYGAVAAICEEFESHQDGSGEPEILMGQSVVLGEIKAEVRLQNENSLNHQSLWQQYIERIESLSPESKVSRFCKEAGFMRVVEVGHYLVTKDNCNLRQFRSVACREYTLPRDDPASEAKGWIQGNMRIGRVLEVTTSFQHFKYGIEIRIWSVIQDNSQSWV